MSTSAVVSEPAGPAEQSFPAVTGRPERIEGPFASLRRQGWEEFSSLPDPGPKDEQWRFSKLRNLDWNRHRAPEAAVGDGSEDLVRRSQGLESSGGRMVFSGDSLVLHEAGSNALKEQGVIWKPLEQAALDHPDLFARYFMTQPAVLGGAKFAALHKAWLTGGTFLFVPRGVEVQAPLEVFHWLYPGSSIFPHTLLVAEEMSSVTLIDYFRSSERNGSGFACGVNDLIVGQNAKLTYVCVQDWGSEVQSVQINNTVAGRDAHATSVNLNLGSLQSRTESVSRLTEAGARSDMLAVSVAAGREDYDHRTLQDHQHADTSSDLLYKNVLDESARSIFAGLIRVEPHAHRTDAYQKVRNLLLSEDAEANSMPGLEILADQVKCSHGATSGQIDEEELFYLQARGIPPALGRQLIAEGFVADTFERLDDETLVEHLCALVREKFQRSKQPAFS